jgi:hypothetical protein
MSMRGVVASLISTAACGVVVAACSGGGSSPSPSPTPAQATTSPTAANQVQLVGDNARLSGALLMNAALLAGDGSTLGIQVGRSGDAHVELVRQGGTRSQNCRLEGAQLFKDVLAASDRIAAANLLLTPETANVIANAYGGVVLIPASERLLVRGFGQGDVTASDRSTFEQLLILVAKQCHPA